MKNSDDNKLVVDDNACKQVKNLYDSVLDHIENQCKKHNYSAREVYGAILGIKYSIEHALLEEFNYDMNKYDKFLASIIIQNSKLN